MRAHGKADCFSRAAVDVESLARYEHVNSFVTEHPLHLSRNVRVLPAHQLRPMLDDRHAAAEAAVCLGQFEPDIAPAEYEQMRRHVVKLQRLDMGKWSDSLEARNARDGRVRADVEEHLVAHEEAR